ncbi:VOC family protein [Myxococcota bacterium]|nr:VOC family protein [Myxococcota bacterium]
MADGYARLDDLFAADQVRRQRALPFLWFSTDAEHAAQRYVEIFGGRVVDTMRAGDAVIACTFEILGLRLVALNGNRGPSFTDAFSVQVPCDSQAEIDRVWDALLADGGQESMCGWLRDRFGVAWQVVPAELPRFLSNPRAVAAMMGMRKLDIAALEGA